MGNKVKTTGRTDYSAKLMGENIPFAIKESFGLLRTNLFYTSSTGEKCAVFAITSDMESSGKSMIIANLALSFAQADKKVLLVDADMRCPVQHHYFGYDTNRAGLSEYLSGIVREKKDFIFPSHVEGLDLLGSGHIPPNPSELVLNPRFVELLETLKEDYDYIFVDFPPIGIVSDAVAIVKVVTGYIFVARAGRSKEQTVTSGLAAMQAVGANVVGVVLNDVNSKSGKGNYNYYYYGSGNGEKKKRRKH